jgi:hypothetical protein
MFFDSNYFLGEKKVRGVASCSAELRLPPAQSVRFRGVVLNMGFSLFISILISLQIVHHAEFVHFSLRQFAIGHGSWKRAKRALGEAKRAGAGRRTRTIRSQNAKQLTRLTSLITGVISVDDYMGKR